MGLVEKSELDKRTNQYSLTEEGYETVLDQLGWMFSNIVTDEDRAGDIESLVEDVQ
jgi:hypothetical protein